MHPSHFVTKVMTRLRSGRNNWLGHRIFFTKAKTTTSMNEDQKNMGNPKRICPLCDLKKKHDNRTHFYKMYTSFSV